MTLPASLAHAAAHVLDSLMAELAGAVSLVVATADGFDVAARVRGGGQAARLAAMASSIAAIGAVVGEESQVGAHRSIIIEAAGGYVVLVDIAHPVHPMVLSVVADKSAVLGQAVYLARQAAARLVQAN